MTQRREIERIKIRLLKNEVDHRRNKQQQCHSFSRNRFEDKSRVKTRYERLSSYSFSVSEYCGAISEMKHWRRVQIDVSGKIFVDAFRMCDVCQHIPVS